MIPDNLSPDAIGEAIEPMSVPGVPEITTICLMEFATSLEGVRNIRVQSPRSNLNAENIQAPAALLIAANPFDETVGELTRLNRASIVTTSTLTLFEV